MVRLPDSDHRILTTDGIMLEARWDEPDEPRAAVVFCHPHPQYGGTMHAPLMYRITRSLVERGLSVLRFNFRGVGGSGGTWGGGTSEIRDVGAAIADARTSRPDLPLGIAGWSFGAFTSLRWQAEHKDRSPYVGIALPVGMFPLPDRLASARRTLVIGDRDQFATVDDTRRYANTIGASVEVLPGSDHFFTFRHERLADIITGVVAQ